MGDKFKNIKGSKIINRSTINTANSDTQNENRIIKSKKPWYQKPTGLIAIGLLIAISSRYIAHILGW